MLGMDKALTWMFTCCGISPASSHVDKYFAITASILIIMLPVEGMILAHIPSGSYKGLFLTIMQFLSALSTLRFIISNWMEPERYMKIIKDLETTGNKLQSTNVQRILMITCVITAILTLIQLAIFYQISFYLAMYMLVNILLINGPSLQHIVLVERIQNRFSALNNLIADIATDMTMASKELDNVFYIHSFLHGLVVDVDIHFCFYNLFNYVSKFIFCVYEMYGYLASIENDNNQLSYTLILSFLRQIVFFISQALVCHACSQEANRTVLLAHRVLQPDTPFELWEKIGLFSALAVGNKVHFTVGGIFTLDRGLITQTALTALSYLIIAIQLRDIKLF